MFVIVYVMTSTLSQAEEDSDELQEETRFQSEPDLKAQGSRAPQGFPQIYILLFLRTCSGPLSRSSRDTGPVQKQFGTVPGLQPVLQLLGQATVPADIIL